MSRHSTSDRGRANAFVQFYRWVFGIGYERNIGGPERTVRYTLGAVFSIIGIGLLVTPIVGDFFLNGAVALILFAGGLFLIYEAQVQYCPLNHTFERSTYSER